MKKFLSITLVSFSLALHAQTAFEVGGYLKYMPSQTWVNTSILPPIVRNAFPESFDDHLLHNRINVRLYTPFSEGPPWFTAELGLRNRAFYGYQSGTDAFLDALEVDPGWIDMRWLWNRGDDVVLHSEIDRLFFRFENARYKVTVGRQRINWGIHNVFNPNDIFNQYNYFDFDYEERPGVDAVHGQYLFTDGVSAFEVAYSPDFNDATQSTGAVLFRSNWRKYDWQVLTGYARGDWVIGGGWAGSLGSVGFKGEAAYYYAIDEMTSSESNFTATVGWDYMLSNGTYLSASYLYNGLGSLNPTLLDQLALRETRLSSKNIFPYRHTLMVSASVPIGALWHADLSWFQSHAFDQVALIPGLGYSITNNLDLLVIAQIFGVKNMEDELSLFTSALYGRIKWSF